MKSRAPRWSESTFAAKKDLGINANVLDFKGKAKVASVKNFVLMDPSEQDDVMLFGKECDSVFNLDVKWPLSLLQAFAIAVSSVAK